MSEFDTLIKSGTIFDGARAPRFVGDIAIKNGIIAKIDRAGAISANRAAKVIDAKGLNVAPGFVDLHTHYDAQLMWDPYLTTSSWHGVTSVAIGNCGFGFAPVKPAERERAMLTMERVEAIPLATMKAGINWSWETFPEWLDNLERSPKGINVLSFVPIGPLMVYVMGQEDSKLREPTRAELSEMCRLLELSLEAGGCGWSAQRLGDGYTSVQRDYDGTPMATDLMSDETCFAFAEVLRRRGEGFIQLTQAKADFKADLTFTEKLAEVAQRPILFNAVQINNRHPHQHRRLLDWGKRMQEKGLQIWLQGITTANDMRFTFEDFNLFDGDPAWREVTLGTVAERAQKMRNPEYLAALRYTYDHGSAPLVSGPISGLFIERTVKPENKKYEGVTIAELGTMRGKHPIDALMELVTGENLATVIYIPPFNKDTDYMQELLDSPFIIPGVSDGGAHTKFLSFGRYPTELLVDEVRSKGLISLEEAHYRLSAMPAICAGFVDRGTLVEGAPADIVIYDYDNLKLMPSEVVHDLPGNEWRRVEKAEGYRHILINGVETFTNDVCTGAIPGKLLRHGLTEGRSRLVAAQ